MNWIRNRTNLNFWDRFYKTQNVIEVPSQFAAFIAGEVAPCRMLEIGCGNGRDSFFFASLGFDVAAFDNSEAAIARCLARKNELGASVHFQTASLSDADLILSIAANPSIVYSRFLLHAISEREEVELFELADRISGEVSIALEFRTEKDRLRAKATSDHFRRFIDPTSTINIASRFGFSVRYFVEGIGFAKYLQDDAHVARCVFERRTIFPTRQNCI